MMQNIKGTGWRRERFVPTISTFQIPLPYLYHFHLQWFYFAFVFLCRRYACSVPVVMRPCVTTSDTPRSFGGLNFWPSRRSWSVACLHSMSLPLSLSSTVGGRRLTPSTFLQGRTSLARHKGLSLTSSTTGARNIGLLSAYWFASMQLSTTSRIGSTSSSPSCSNLHRILSPLLLISISKFHEWSTSDFVLAFLRVICLQTFPYYPLPLH